MSKTTMSTIIKLIKSSNDEKERGNKEASENFLAKAQEICERNNIDIAEAQGASAEDRNRMEVRRIRVGEARKVGLKTRTWYLSSIVSQMLNIKTNVRLDGTSVILFGTVEQNDQAQEIIESALEQNEAGIPKAKKEVKEKGDRFSRVDYDNGFFMELYKLSEEISNTRKEFIDEFLPQEGEELTPQGGQALALRAMEVQVTDFYNENSTAKGTFRCGGSGGTSLHSLNAGAEQGKVSTLSSQKSLH